MSQKTAEVTTFIQNVNHPLKKGMKLLREVILSAHKDITEHIKWKAPSFCYNGEDRVTFNLHKNDCIVIVFHRGAKVKDSKDFVFKDSTGLLEWVATDRALVTFRDTKDIQDKKEALKNLVIQWIQSTTE